MMLPKMSAPAVRTGPGNRALHGVFPSLNCTVQYTCNGVPGQQPGAGPDQQSCCMNAGQAAMNSCQPPKQFQFTGCS